MTVLINLPRSEQPGGVTNFYNVLRNHLDAEYFEVGAKNGSSIFGRMLSDYWRFHKVLSNGVSLVHLNPSLRPKSVLRDAIFLLIASAHSVPVLTFFHGWDEQLQARIEHRFSRLFGYVLNKSAAIVVLAEEFRGQLKNMGISVPIHVATTCVDDAIFEQQISRSYSQLNVLYLGRLERGKGLITAIKAFAELKNVRNATLTIAGDGARRAAAEQFVADNDIENVHFLGHLEGDAKRRAFMEANAYLFTSTSEGMPTTVLEAMAYGLPVITSRIGGLKDFFEDGRMGFATETRDFAALLNKLDPELCRSMGEYNRRYARDHFAASMVAKSLKSYYTELTELEVLLAA